jgi:hypothetical protein
MFTTVWQSKTFLALLQQHLGRGLGLVVRAAAGCHAGAPGSILGRDHSFIHSIHLDAHPKRREHSWDGYMRYTKVLI